MDLLTQILRSARVSSPLIADLRLGPDVSLGIPGLAGIPFHYVVEGRCRIRLPRSSVELGPGDFVMLPRWPSYRLETGEGRERSEVLDFAKAQGLPNGFLQMSLERPLLEVVGGASLVARVLSGIVAVAAQESGPLTRDLPEVVCLQDARSQLEPWLGAAMDLVAVEGYAPEPGFGAVAERLIELVFVAMLRRWFVQSDHEKGWMRGLNDPTVSRALSALHAEPGRDWTLQALAVTSGRSRSGFAKHFRDVMGEAPFAYLARWRMHLASSLVTQERQSLATIGASLGYRSANSFARAFASSFGVTPAQYRKRSRADHAPDFDLRPTPA